jgi:crotonobetainyl-CoA:carnitine CoA-transferase CaiB-like acyl-CoA transferase
VIYDGLRVADCSTGVAGGYCSKLLTDLGADVVKLEPDSGDQLRTERPELFDYLHASQRSVVTDDLGSWVANADIVLETFVPGEFEARGLMGVAPVTVSISPFGRGGPDSTLMLPEQVLQARSGSLSNHGHMDKPPLTVGGGLGEYLAGAFGALGAVTAWRKVRGTDRRETVDVSMFEAMHLTFVTFPTLMSRFPGGRLMTFRWVMLPGNEPCKDGNYVGITAVTKQNWLSLLKVIGREDLLDDEELATMLGRFKRAAEVNEMVQGFTMRHTAEEMVELCAAERVPAAVVANGELLPTFPQMRERDAFVRQPGRDWIRPRAPFRFSAVTDRELTPAPHLDEHSADRVWSSPTKDEEVPSVVGGDDRPLAGLKVLDFTAFWSGPCATAWFVAMGADVVKVESIQRPDGIRFSASVRPSEDDRYYEMSGLFHAVNLGKKGITLDLGNPEGLAAAKRLIERCDIVAENFTPRVMDSFGLSYDEVRAIRPDVIYLRLPAFGLTGSWRDRPGFAQTMEQLTGMAWVTGYEGGPPIIPGGLVDPAVGVHTATAVIAAVTHRDRTGEGQLVESPMIEVAAAMTAEQVIEFSAHGRVVGRRGEGGVYRCEGEGEQWVAVDRASDPLPAEARAAWCAQRSPDAAVKELLADGIPAAAMVPAFATLDDPHLQARGFFQTIENPIVGTQDYPGWPVRFGSWGGAPDWWPGPAPTLGQHNDEVLRAELGVTDDDLARLRAEGVIGEHPAAPA